MAKPSKTGRPSKFNPDYHIPWAQSLAMEGKTDKEIADRMGVSRSTLSKWKVEHKGFSEALDLGKEIADSKVEQALYKRAIGYKTKEKKVIVSMDADGNQKPARIETYEKEIPPDTTAQIFWLKNRKRNAWKDKQDIEMETDQEIVFNILPASERKEEKEE